ncbi:MAG TPA: hypothetical protein VNK95_07810 [Caldilineaceae bacterium]|nr:hypothetical protein [Caldilineaceae bacterium]
MERQPRAPAPDAATAGEAQTPIPQEASGALNRRRFLVGAAGALTAALAACGRSRRGTPTPSPALTATATQVGRSSVVAHSQLHELHLPLVHNAPDGAVAMAEPALTPTPPKPTDTPTPEPPTPTPTPEATPFPPGPPSKLGLFVARNHPDIFAVLESGGVTVLKTLELDKNFVAEVKRISPRTKVIGRLPDGDLAQISLGGLDPIPAARSYVERLLPYADDPERRPYFDGWETYNEPVANNADEMRRWADFEAERTRLLAERGIRSVIGNFGTGQPPLELWEHFLPALQAAQEHDGWLGLHEYSAPTIYYMTTRENQGRYPGVSPEDTGWLTLRYRHVYNQFLIPRGLAIPLVFTELGVDGLVANRPGPADAKGWQHFQQYWAENGYGLWGPGAYIEQLVWFDEAMRQNDYVIGGCIFAMAASQGWESYDILGPAAGVLRQYLSVHAPG